MTSYREFPRRCRSLLYSPSYRARSRTRIPRRCTFCRRRACRRPPAGVGRVERETAWSAPFVRLPLDPRSPPARHSAPVQDSRRVSLAHSQTRPASRSSRRASSPFLRSPHKPRSLTSWPCRWSRSAPLQQSHRPARLFSHESRPAPTASTTPKPASPPTPSPQRPQRWLLPHRLRTTPVSALM